MGDGTSIEPQEPLGAILAFIRERAESIRELDELSESSRLGQEVLKNFVVGGNLSFRDIVLNLGGIIQERVEASGIAQNIPFYGSQNFVGREAELERLQGMLRGGQRVAVVSVSGMGGVGKTELAVQYAMRHLEEYAAGVCWLNVGGGDLGGAGGAVFIGRV